MDENWYAVEEEIREQLRKAWVGMWSDPYLMDPYIQEALRREHIAKARRQAAVRARLAPHAAPSRLRSRCWALVQRLALVAASLRPKRRIAGGNAEERQALAHE
jgi:hypothetical protein